MSLTDEVSKFITNTTSAIDSYLNLTRNIISDFEKLKEQANNILLNGSSKEAIKELIEDFPINDITTIDIPKPTMNNSHSQSSLHSLNSSICHVVINKLSNDDLNKSMSNNQIVDDHKDIDTICNLNVSISKPSTKTQKSNSKSNKKKNESDSDDNDSDDNDDDIVKEENEVNLDIKDEDIKDDSDNESFKSLSSVDSMKSKKNKKQIKSETEKARSSEQSESIKSKTLLPEFVLPKSLSDEETTQQNSSKSEITSSSEENATTSKRITRSCRNKVANKIESSESKIDTDEEEITPKRRKRIRKSNESKSDSDESTIRQSGRKKRKQTKKNDLETDESDKNYESNDETDINDDESDESVKTEKSNATDKKKSKRTMKKLPDSENESNNEEEKTPSKTRQKLRKLIDEQKLDKTTKSAVAAEDERKKRIEEKKKALETNGDIIECDEAEVEETNKQQAIKKALYLDITKDGKKRIKVDEAIAEKLKPHQKEGVQFMWDSMYESVEMIAEGNKGSGCLLAHCMGLGKTFQTVALVHTLFNNQEETKVKRVLILMPINVLINWKNEFKKWTLKCKVRLNIFDLSSSASAASSSSSLNTTKQRIYTIESWFKRGGVLLMGYTMFARLVQGTGIKSKALKDRFIECLIKPGADLVICDEGHIMKNEKTAIAKTICQVETLRRVVLTGTPLQNNLIEYHCMVSFVKPALLGTKKEFMNRFVNPINNGQHKDSTDDDVRLMKKRAHVLHNTLDASVQRKDYNIIRDLLPPKNEYVVLIRLSDKQIELYRKYLEHRGITNVKHLGKVAGAQLFADFQTLSRIITHPWTLKVNQDRLTLAESKCVKNFLDNDEEETSCSDESGSNSDSTAVELNLDLNDDDDDTIVTKKKNKIQDSDNNSESVVSDSDQSDVAPVVRRTNTRRSLVAIEEEKKNKGGRVLNTIQSSDEDIEEVEKEFWWSNLVDNSCESDISLSGKLVIFDMILKMCEEVGDKLIVFSQSLMSLNLIEKFLQVLDSKDYNWKKNRDYFRIDGTTDLAKRSRECKLFNDASNHRARLYLISTKAGGIGINLIGANRCIVFDASWNPSYDTQSIFRIYRFGQTKPVFIYRFLSQGTMEEKIYQRQVNKQSLAQRVVDEHQLDRHFTSDELKELYRFEPNIYDPDIIEYPNMPVDNVLKNLLLDAKKWIFSYHEHDSLLENKIGEGLSEEDRQAAWAEYEAEKSRPTFYNAANFSAANFENMTRQLQQGQQPNNLTNLYDDPNSFLQQQLQQQQLQQQLYLQQMNQMINQASSKRPSISQIELQQHLAQQNNLNNQNQNIRNPQKTNFLVKSYREAKNSQERRNALLKIYQYSPELYYQLVDSEKNQQHKK